MGLELYEARLAAAEGDAAALMELADELGAVPAAWARRMRLQAISEKVKLNASGAKLHNPLADWGLPLPEKPGLPFYRLRLSDAIFLQLEEALKSSGSRLVTQPNLHDAAKFVIWASEWFRRKFDGRARRWADLGAPINLRLDHHSGKQLCSMGFSYWNVPLLRLDHSTQYLASIARQAGFPVAALDSGTGGWAHQYLTFIVGRMLGNNQTNIEDAIAHAVEGQGCVPSSWCGEELRAACAELAVAIVALRQYAERCGATHGLPVSHWLDINIPDWRLDLPISINATSTGFIDGLMAAKPLKGGGGSVRVSRLLCIENGAREEYLKLHLSGTLKQIDGWAGTSLLSSEFSRLRLYAAGRLSDLLPGHLAIAEPCEKEDWSTFATSDHDCVRWPLSMPAEAELRGNDRRIGNIFTFPGGVAVGMGLRIWSACDSGNASLPNQWQLAGTGSGAFRSDNLWIDVPQGWSISTPDDKNPPKLIHEDMERSIWQICSATHVRTPQHDVYFIRPGQADNRKDALRLLGEPVRGLVATDNQMPIFKGWPEIIVSENGKGSPVQRREVFWRPQGNKSWQPFGTGVPFGPCEFAWRDIAQKHIRAKAEAIILPKEFDLQCQRNAHRLLLDSVGWGGTIVVPEHSRNTAGQWFIPLDYLTKSYVDVQITMPLMATVTVRYQIPMRAWIGTWSGGLCPKNAKIALADLHSHVARTDRSTDLLADLYDYNNTHLPQGQTEWDVNGELGLATLHDDIAALLRPAGIDAKVKLNFNDGHENYWFVTQFDNGLQWDSLCGLRSTTAIIDDDVRILGRFLGSPHQVENLGVYDCFSNFRGRNDLPPLSGPWLIYLEKNGRTLTRPYLLAGKNLAIPPRSALGRAMVREAPQRLEDLRTILAECVDNPENCLVATHLRNIIDLAVSLGDLPPLTFEIFKLLPEYPDVMVRLIFACANEEEISHIMGLERGLPFSWLCAPRQSWNDALYNLQRQIYHRLQDAGIEAEKALEIVKEAVAGFIRPVIQFEPALAIYFSTAGSDKKPIDEIVASFLDRSSDRIGKEQLQNPFRPAFEGILHNWPGAKHYRRAIDAPIIAAHIAKEGGAVSPEQIACIKEIARRHPRYLSECYAAIIRE